MFNSRCNLPENSRCNRSLLLLGAKQGSRSIVLSSPSVVTVVASLVDSGLCQAAVVTVVSAWTVARGEVTASVLSTAVVESRGSEVLVESEWGSSVRLWLAVGVVAEVLAS